MENEANIELKKVCTWLASNKLTLNVDKSKFMLTVKSRKSLKSFSLKINDEKLKQCDSYKYLGVYMDRNLTWKQHIEHVRKKVAKACGSLARIRHYVHIDTLIEIYYALIHSYVRYGITVWGNASKSALQPLMTSINRAARIMTFAPYGNICGLNLQVH